MDLNIEIENFKSVKSASLHLREGLNVLVGPNGSGKTCLLSALKFLRDILQTGAAEALARSGGAKRVYHRGQSRMKFAVSQDYGVRTFRQRKHRFTLHWEVEISQRGPEKIATIISEKVTIDAQTAGRRSPVLVVSVDRRQDAKPKSRVWLRDRDELGKDVFCRWQGQSYAGRKSQIWNELLPRVRRLVRGAKKTRDVPVLRMMAGLDFMLQSLCQKFISLDEYSILPDVARMPSEQLQVARMRPNGGAVSEVIHALQNKHFHKVEGLGYPRGRTGSYYDSWEYWGPFGGIWYEYPHVVHKRRYPREVERILENINRELAAGVRSIDSVIVEVEETTGKRGLVFCSGKDKFYPEEVSDGTMKWLCILVSIFVGHSSVYLLEEPENFVHPWMQQRMIGIMREDAKRSGTIFVVTSHSATILNGAMPEEVSIVTHSGKGTQLNEIVDIGEIEKILADSDFGLGDLWVSGAIGGTPAHG